MCLECIVDMTAHRFKASDGKGGIAAADISINLCNCSGHGECLFDLLADGYELKQTFRIVQCNCSIGWEGRRATYISKYTKYRIMCDNIVNSNS